MSPRPAIDHIRRPQILKAAAEVITERGFAGTRIADVAERAGTSAPAVLYWFESRERLLTEALTADEGAFEQALDERLAGLDSSRAKLLAILEASSSDGDLSLWIELWARSLHDPVSGGERRRLDREWRERIAVVVTAGQRSGEFGADIDAAGFALKLAALIDGLGVQATLGDPDVSVPRMLEACCEFAELELGVQLREDALEVTTR